MNGQAYLGWALPNQKESTLPVISRVIRGIVLLLASLPLAGLVGTSQALAQVTSAQDGAGTRVTRDGDRYIINGGALSRDGENLFHSFDQFGLDADQTANFLTNSQIQNILGRITGGDASIIHGLIQVTGGDSNLYLINPAGIIFGASARLDVPGSFTATTADGIGFGNRWFSAIADNNYASLVSNPSSFAFTSTQPGSILNAGNLRVGEGQQLTLLGGTVINTGILTSPGGQITVAAVPGENLVRISQEGRLLSLDLETIGTQVGGRLGLPFTPLSLPELLTAGNVEHATGVTVNRDGTVSLTGSNLSLSTEPGTAIASGTLNASRQSPNPNPQLPEINVLGDRVALLDATLNAFGNSGGTIRVGGDYQGEGSVPNASVTFVDENSTLNADALRRGNGGRIIVWSEDTTRVYGSLSARGGVRRGNGGLVETSSRGFLDVNGAPDVSARYGLAGTWLIDPYNITIVDAPTDGVDTVNDPFAAIDDNAVLDVDDLIAALTGGTNVIVSTGTAGAQVGNITLQTALDFNGTGSNTLTLQAANDININAEIFDSVAGSDLLNLVLTADSDNSGVGTLRVQPNGRLDTGGGTIVGSGSNDQTLGGVELSGNVSSDASRITFTGTSFQNGVSLTNGTFSLTGNGTLELASPNAGTAVIINGATLQLGDGNLIVTADAIDLPNSTILGTGSVLLQTANPEYTIQVGGNAAGGPLFLDLFATELAVFQDGFDSITIGRADGSGQVNLLGDLTFNDPVTLQATGTGGSINTTGGTITGQGNASVTLRADQNVVTGNIATAGQGITISSTTGGIDTSAGTVTTNLTGGAGGAIALTAAGNITTGPLSFGAAPGTNALTIDTPGEVDLRNGLSSTGGEIVIGGVTRPSSVLLPENLDTNGGGFSLFPSGDINLTGNIITDGGNFTINGNGSTTFSGAVQTVGGDFTILNSGATLVLGSVSTGSGNFRIESGGTTSVSSPINTDGGDFTIDSVGEILLSGAIATNSGDFTLTSEATTSVSAPISTGGGIFLVTSQGDVSFTEAITTGGGSLSTTSEGAIAFSSPVTTSGGSILLDGNQINTAALDASNITGTGGAVSLLSDTAITTGDLNSSGTSGGNISVNAITEITTGAITTGGGSLSTMSEGAIAFSGPVTTSGGSILLDGSQINTAALDTSNSTGAGGAISLFSDTAITTGNLNSSGTSGGNISVNAITEITTGAITATGTTGDGGSVTLDPTGDIQVTSINTSSQLGRGGQVDITTERFFRATGLVEGNSEGVSILSSGGAGGGDITIRHGGNGETPFIVGDGTTNGTAGTITSGDSAISSPPNRSFRGSVTVGNIRIITDFEDPGVDPGDPDGPDGREDPDEPGIGNPIIPRPECQVNCERPTPEPQSEPDSNTGSSPTTPQPLVTARNTLLDIQQETGVKPALIYVGFVPVESTFNSGFAEREATASQQFEQYLGRQSSQDESVALSFQPQPTDELELLLITSSGEPIRKRLAGVTRAEVEQARRKLVSQITDPRLLGTGYLPPAQQLYQWLIAPLEQDLQAEEIENLSFILDTGLRFIPLAALHDGDQFLVEKYSVGLMPSLSLTDTRYTNMRSLEVLAMGASEFSDQLPLPAVPTELRTIVPNLWPGEILLNADFTVQNLRQQREQRPFGILHLATHGEFRSGGLGESYIQFWNQKLRLDEIRQLGLSNPPLELLVLSACRTALGDEQAELGFAGLAVQAGVKSALASLWYVSDEGTLALMTEFYGQLREVPIKAEALRQTQIAMLNGEVRLQDGEIYTSRSGAILLPDGVVRNETQDLSHPFYWAAFTLIGSPW
ncbi:CHAT domain-containing protein [Oculatella sp. FACHB-28]|uniref:CHAT domain-containing protein n=1 Tax=Oculatella sp. FACHB-28 TaxID=2692845 RepID=UPI0016871B5A|nr:CHAT domain-containing protein [Oculatella sp. FACHB-28]MBD2056264.1 CHAT domain-containing protein [Oculatella sp. FACHB-28]